MWRNLAAVLALSLLGSAVRGQTHSLIDSPKSGDCIHYDISMTLKGELRINRDGKTVAIPLTADARHQFAERVLEAKEKGLPEKVARYYEVARSTLHVDGAASAKSLRPQRRLIVGQRGESLLCYSPAGPLTRDEVELVSEHFEAMAITGILPSREVRVGETWKLNNDAVQSLCLFEGLISHDFSAKLDDVSDGFANISVSGKAQGIELGALAKISIVAKARFELLPRKLVSLEWTQKDERDQGPVSPASTVEATTMVKRSAMEQPKELSDAALEGVPTGSEVPPALTLVYHRDGRDRYDVAVTREWNLVAQTENHLVLRLVDRGELVAQVALTAWTKADPGKHIDPEEFKRVMAETPGWQLDEILDAGEVPGDNGRWAYRIIARGQMDELKVVQNCYIVANSNGDQVAATFTMKPGQVAKLGSRDLTLVGSIGFPRK
jgi:hypothetical protein